VFFPPHISSASALPCQVAKDNTQKTAHCACNSPAAWALLTSFLLNRAPTAPSWMHCLQSLGSHTAAWVWVVSQKDWRNQVATGWILAFEWKMQFLCFPVLPGSAEAHLIWGGIVKWLLIAYFSSNISAKNIKICSRGVVLFCDYSDFGCNRDITKMWLFLTADGRLIPCYTASTCHVSSRSDADTN